MKLPAVVDALRNPPLPPSRTSPATLATINNIVYISSPPPPPPLPRPYYMSIRANTPYPNLPYPTPPDHDRSIPLETPPAFLEHTGRK